MGNDNTTLRNILLGASLTAALGLSGCSQEESRDYSDADTGAGATTPETRPETGMNSEPSSMASRPEDGQQSRPASDPYAATGGNADEQRGGQSMSGQSDEYAGATEDVQEAADVLKRLKEQEPALAQQLADANGVFIIPDYATAALLVGGSGGEGVMMEKRDGGWGNPGFYDIGNIDLGIQAGAAGGSIVMLLMSDEAVQSFHQPNDFALTADAGLTIVNWSPDATDTDGDGDVIVWSDNSGLLAEASIGLGGMSWDEEEAREYYGQDVTPEQVLAGDVDNPQEPVLRSEFAEFTTSDRMAEDGRSQQ